jgi:hypothetical protein
MIKINVLPLNGQAFLEMAFEEFSIILMLLLEVL